MGFLANLIQRWFGTKPSATRRALPSPARRGDQDSDHRPAPPVATAALPWQAPITGDAEPPVEVAPQPPSPAVPRPLGLPGDLQASPDLVPPSSESASLREWMDQPLVAGGDLTADQLAAFQQGTTTKVGPPTAIDPAVRADRRRERAAAVAERRAADIRYLGRGVSAALNDRQSDQAKLERAGLPLINSPAELAERLGISIPRLRWLAFHAEVASRVHYVSFEVAKKGGGTRRLSAPHRSMALAQRWIHEEIVARLPVEPRAHGFVPGRSIVTNAQGHSGRAIVVNLDLEGFFPSIGHRRVRAVFERTGYSPAIASILGLLCTEAPRRAVTLEGATLHVATGPRGLPQGACTSPGLSNQVARRLDRRLGGLAGKLGANYTRYADDLTFSGGPDLDPKVGYLMAQVRRIATSEGFTVNEAKTRVLRRNTAQVVTGLVVNDRPGVPRVEVRRLRAILHRARVEGLDAQNRDARPDFRAWLLGKIAFVGMARPDVGARLLAAYRAVEAPRPR